MSEMNLKITIAPHVHSGAKTSKIMLYVILALLPAMAVSVYNFGPKVVMLYCITVFSCIVFEHLFNMATNRKCSIKDYSAIVTGILLAMNLPVSAPVWMPVVGAFVAIIIAKMVFGGLGSNPFNPALVGRIFLLISFPAQMTAWTMPDGKSGATLLGIVKTHLSGASTLKGLELPALQDTLAGFTAGSLGETSAAALILGGIFLIATRVITWHIPVAFLGTVLVLTTGYHFAYPNASLHPLLHITSGGLMLGAFFMATDYSSSPVFAKGKIIFGIGCGLLTVLIRLFGGYPEGVAFAILIMNAFVPLLDKYIRPKIYGEVKP